MKKTEDSFIETTGGIDEETEEPVVWVVAGNMHSKPIKLTVKNAVQLACSLPYSIKGALDVHRKSLLHKSNPKDNRV
jgi:hypothetical protein